jgi:hypothetical protein
VRVHVDTPGVPLVADDETELVSMRERAEVGGGRVAMLDGGQVEL